MISFSDKIKELRIGANRSQEQASNAVGISKRAYIYYESGEREPSMSTLIALADYFDVPLDYLAGRGLFTKEHLLERPDIMAQVCETIRRTVFAGTIDGDKVTSYFFDKLQSDIPIYKKISLLSAFIEDVELCDDSLKIHFAF